MIPKPTQLATLPFLLLLLLFFIPDLSNGSQVKLTETCFPDKLNKGTDPNFSEDITKFGLKLFKALLTSPQESQSSENVVVSPFSVWSALVLVYLSSAGQTHDELKRTLKLETKIGTQSERLLLKEHLTQAGNLRVDSSSSTEGRQPRQEVTSSSTQTNTQQSSQSASENSNSKQSTSEGSSSSTSTTTSSGGSSSSTMTTCTNGVCTTTSTDTHNGNRDTETCETGTDGVTTCVIETCSTDASGTEMCITETCTTDAAGVEACVERRRRKRDETGVKHVARSGRSLGNAEISQAKGVGETETPVSPESGNTEIGKETSVLPKSRNTETLAKHVEEAPVLPETEDAETLATGVEETAVLPSSEVDDSLAINPKEPAVLPKQTHTIKSLTAGIKESAVLPEPNVVLPTYEVTKNTGKNGEEPEILPESEASETPTTGIKEAALLPSPGVDAEGPSVLPESDGSEILATDIEEHAVLPESDATKTIVVENKDPAVLPSSEDTHNTATNTEELALSPEQTHTTDIKQPAVLPKSEAGETQVQDTEKPAVSPEQTRTITQENCTTDATGNESCTTTTTTGATTCTITEETKARSNIKAGTASARGTTTFTSKDWVYISDTLRLRTCLPSTLPEIMTIDFSRTTSAANIINAEVRKATDDAIGNLVEPEDLTGAVLMLLNAVHFKGEWLTPFSVNDTMMANFYASPPPSTALGKVEMMKVVSSFKFARRTSLNASALLLPYASSSFSLLLLLPQTAEVGVDGVVNRLNLKRLQDAINKAQDKDMEVYLPKFSIKSHHSQGLQQALSSVGLSQLFSGLLDLSTLTSTPLRLSSIIQQATIEVDEQGTTSGAATGLSITKLEHRVKVRFNHPFIFLLMDMKHLIPVAAGVYRKPTA